MMNPERLEDYVEKVIYTSSHDTLLFFSNLGKVYKLRAFQIPSASRLAKGLPVVNLLNFDETEKLAAILNINEKEDYEGYFIFATRNGIIKKTETSAFKNIRANGIKAILLADDDELFQVELTDGEKDIILGASNGKGIRFSESDIRPMGRISAGVRGIKVEKPDKVVGMAIVSTDGDEIVIVTDKGYGKRTLLDQFHVQHRGGKGLKCYKIMEKTGYVVGVKAVNDSHEIMMITDQGVIIQLRMEDIKIISRNTSGVKMIDLDDGIEVAKIAKVRDKVSDGTTEYNSVDEAAENIVVIHDEIDFDEVEDDDDKEITFPTESEEE